jgi:hypothetical protein
MNELRFFQEEKYWYGASPTKKRLVVAQQKTLHALCHKKSFFSHLVDFSIHPEHWVICSGEALFWPSLSIETTLPTLDAARAYLRLKYEVTLQ